MGMNAPHTLKDQLAAALAEKQRPDVDKQIAQLDRLLADRRALERNQGGPRYARHLPELPHDR